MERPADTSEKFWKIYLEQIGKLSPVRKLEMTTSLFDTAQHLLICGLRSRFPDASPRLLLEMMLIRFYGNDMTENMKMIILQEIRTGPFRPGWRKILGISDDEPVD